MRRDGTDLPLTEAERAELARLAEMAELGSSEGRRHRFNEVFQTLFGRSLEVAGPTIVAMAHACTKGGRTTAESAIEAGGIRIFSPATSRPFSKALAIEAPGANFVAVVKDDSAPDPQGDALASRLLRSLGITDDHGERARHEATKPREIETVKVLRYWKPFPGHGDMPTDADGCARAVALINRHACSYRPTLEETLAKATGRGFQTNMLIEARTSSPPYSFDPGVERKEWREGMRSVRDIQASLGFFSGLHGAVTALALQEPFAADATDFAERRFEELPGYPDIAAAKALGDVLARHDGYLPRAAALEGLGVLMSLGAVSELPSLINDLEALRTLCLQNGHIAEDERFGYNDDDDFVHAPPSGRPDLDLIALEDQAGHYVVALRRDEAGAIREVSFYLAYRSVDEWFQENFEGEVSAQALAQASGSRFANPYADAPITDTQGAITAAIANADTSLLARFTIGEDGPGCVANTFLRGDHASKWTRIVSLVQSGLCCMEDDYDVEAVTRSMP